MKSKTYLILGVMIAYVSWSQYALWSYRTSLETEKKRVYNMADNLQLIKAIMTDMGGQLDAGKLSQYRRGMKVVEVTRAEALSILEPGEKLYTMTYPVADREAKKELDRYFSDRVLYNYYYIKTNVNGGIVELFWDKP